MGANIRVRAGLVSINLGLVHFYAFHGPVFRESPLTSFELGAPASGRNIMKSLGDAVWLLGLLLWLFCIPLEGSLHAE